MDEHLLFCREKRLKHRRIISVVLAMAMMISMFFCDFLGAGKVNAADNTEIFITAGMSSNVYIADEDQTQELQVKLTARGFSGPIHVSSETTGMKNLNADTIQMSNSVILKAYPKQRLKITGVTSGNQISVESCVVPDYEDPSTHSLYVNPFFRKSSSGNKVSGYAGVDGYNDITVKFDYLCGSVTILKKQDSNGDPFPAGASFEYNVKILSYLSGPFLPGRVLKTSDGAYSTTFEYSRDDKAYVANLNLRVEKDKAVTIYGIPTNNSTGTPTSFSLDEVPQANYELVSASGASSGTLIYTNYSGQTASYTSTSRYTKPGTTGNLEIKYAGNPSTMDFSNLTFSITGPNNYKNNIKYSSFTNGTYTLQDVLAGNYSVSITNADDAFTGYTRTAGTSSASATVEVYKTSTINLSGTYVRDTGNLTIKSTFNGLPSNVDKSGVSYNITGPDNYNTTVYYKNFNNGSYTVTGVPTGNYKVTQGDATYLSDDYEGQNIPTSKNAQVTKTGVAVDFENNYKAKPSKLFIYQSFEGVTPSQMMGLKYLITGPNGYSKTLYFSDFTDGCYIISGLNAGTYTVKEENAETILSGYSLTPDSETSRTVELGVNRSGYAELYNGYMQNQPDTGTIKIKPSFSGQPAGVNWNSLTFSVTGNDFTASATYGTADASGVITIEDVPVGTYTVSEPNAGSYISNYALESDVVISKTVTVSKNGVTEVTFDNRYTNTLGNLKISVVYDAPETSQLNNLKIQITGPENYKNEINFSSFNRGEYVVSGLKAGDYEIKELNASGLIDGYSLDSRSVTTGRATVKSGNTAQVNLTNLYLMDKGSVKVSKTFTGDELPNGDKANLEFVLVKDGSTVERVYYSNFNNGSYVFDDVPTGSYFVRELGADDLDSDYIFNGSDADTSKQVNITKSSQAAVSFVNDYTKKKHEADPEPDVPEDDPKEDDEKTPDKKDDTPKEIVANQVVVKLNSSNLTYTGKDIRPVISEVLADGTALSADKYSVSYMSGTKAVAAAKAVGAYKVVITLKNGYKGTGSADFTVIPKGTKLLKAKPAKKSLTVKWIGIKKGITGYQIQYSTDKNFKKKAKTITVNKAKITNKKIKKLKSKKKYYVRIRTFKKVGKVKYYSSWSKAKKAKVK
ncbi:MAG: hypothetical protein K6F55_01365 [Eubacterium sp.]|nr:hypothetical protein [Eubacterium sp.]